MPEELKPPSMTVDTSSVDDDGVAVRHNKKRRGEEEDLEDAPCLDGKEDNTDDDGAIAMLFRDSIKSEAEEFIAQQMSKLSATEREKIYYDIHGITDFPDETPEFLEKCLTQLRQEITDLQTDELALCKAYDLALSMDANYVHDRDFELRFLRTDRLDPKAAALRLVKHFQVKLELFGPDLLAKQILQDDLPEHTKGALIDGFKQKYCL